MTFLTFTTRDGDSTDVSGDRLDRFGAALTGTLLMPGDAAYDQARTVWNAMIDRRPAAIARCATAADVATAVDFARETGARLAVRGGGHNIAGHAVCDGGLMIDLSAMRGIDVDPATGRVSVGPGAPLADLDAATAAHGLAVPTGINSTTGIAGLTLGGGFGWLTRAYGLTIDSLRSAEVVTADGRILNASTDENADLFWGLRGGGGNFGIVTRFEFQAHRVGPEMLTGLIFLPLVRARELMDLQGEMLRDAPDELSMWVVLRTAPPLPVLPEAVHGTGIAMMALCWAGDPVDGEAAIAPLRAIADPIASLIGVQPFTQWQQVFDPLLTPGARNYWKSHDILEMPDRAIDALIDAAERLPSQECEVFIAHLGGAMARVVPGDTAFAQRRPHFVVNIHTRWREPAEDVACIAWARSLFDALKPHSAGVYVNFMPEEEAGRVAEAYGANLVRLAAIKARFDPDNLFRLNQNIAPARRPALTS